MTNSMFQQRLAQLQGSWQAAQKAAQESSFGSKVPDGRYIAQIVGAEVGESQSSGRLQVAWEYCILEGEHAGEIVRDYDGLETQENLVWLARKLDRLGYETASISFEELEDVLRDCVESRITVQLRLKTKGEYQNAYVDQRLELEVSTSSKPTVKPVRTQAPVPEPTAPGSAQTEDVGPVSAAESALKPGSEVRWTDDDGIEQSGTVRMISPDGLAAQVTRSSDKRLVKIDVSKLQVS